MLDLALTIALPLLIVGLFALALRFIFREQVRWAPLATALLAVLLYWLAVVGGSEVQAIVPAMAELKWNWTGKIAAILATLLLILLLPGVTARSAGVSSGAAACLGW